MGSLERSDVSATETSISSQRVSSSPTILEQSAVEPTTWPRKVQSTTPLYSQDHIRLLQIDSITDLDGIECSLYEYPPPSVSDTSYAALSYCWGDEPQDHTLSINGLPFQVTSNLLGALVEVASFFARPNDMSTLLDGARPRLLWVDAVCLNQEDKAEKSIQVQRMDGIFQNSTITLIWLGNDTPHALLVMLVCQWLEVHMLEAFALQECELSSDDIDELSHKIIDLKLNAAKNVQKEYGVSTHSLEAFRGVVLRVTESKSKGELFEMSNEQLAGLLVDLTDDDDVFASDGLFWSALLSLMDSPWFSRIWTLQEGLLGRDASLLCAGKSLSWSLFLHLRSYFYVAIWNGILYDYHMVELPLQSSRIVFENPWVESLDMNPGEVNKLWSDYSAVGKLQRLLKSTGGVRKAKDPKDSIYGLLGLMDPELRTKLRPNYDLSIAQAFSNVVKVMADEGACAGMSDPVMHFLENMLCYEDNPNLDLPSWCPDFTAKRWSKKGLLAQLNAHDDLKGEPLHPPIMPYITDQMCMLALVVLLDEVEHTVAIVPAEQICEEWWRALRFGNMENVGQMWLDLYPMECSAWFGAVLNLLSHDQIRHSTEKIQWLRQKLWRSIKGDMDEQAIFEILQKGAKFASHGAPEGKVLDPCIEHTGDSNSLLLSALIWNPEKYFLVTRQGRIGYSLKPTRPGDRICYIPGGRALQIVSKDYNEYIAPANVHGLMRNALLEAVGSSPVWTTVTLH